jgi:long-chain acyl-CoA synthetase
MTHRPWLLHEQLLAAAATHGTQTAVVTAEGSWSYAELCERCLRFARALQDLGVRRGDRVVVHLENSLECAVAVYGISLAGGVFAVVSPRTKAEKLEYLLADSEAAVLVTDPRLWDAPPQRPPSLAATVCAGTETPPGCVALDAVLEAAASAPREIETIPSDLAALMYTSGSTGFPKGVMMTHQSVVFTTESVSDYLRLTAGDRILNVLPLSFDYGLYQLLMACAVGATLVLERTFAFPAATARRVEQERVTVVPGVPSIFARLLSLERSTSLRLPSVRAVTNTAASLPPDFDDALQRLFPNALIFRMYGLTECKRVAYLEPELIGERPGSVGKAIPGTEAFVLTSDGSRAGSGEVGILHVRGPHVMAGYWRKPDLSAQMLVDGPLPGEKMLCTQDRFHTDEDGFLYFVGRTDDIIKTAGQKVSPAEVENALYAITGVTEAAVVGRSDSVEGERVVAFVAVDSAELDEPTLRRLCRERLEPHLVPAEIHVLPELPKTDSGKITKVGLVG